jgi:adenylyltransferase/sulfurtransferase
MPRVTFTLPRLLEPAVGSSRRVELDAGSIAEGIDLLLEHHPTLRVHLFDEQGSLRQHVLCFVGGSQTRLEDRNTPITEPTQITFLQAVSGGAL